MSLVGTETQSQKQWHWWWLHFEPWVLHIHAGNFVECNMHQEAPDNNEITVSQPKKKPNKNPLNGWQAILSQMFEILLSTGASMEITPGLYQEGQAQCIACPFPCTG